MFIYEINCQQQYFQHNSPVCLDLRAWCNIPLSMLLQKHMRFTKITGKTRHRPSADGISEKNTTRQTSHSFINSYVVQINTEQFNVWNKTRNGYVSWYIYRFLIIDKLQTLQGIDLNLRSFRSIHLHRNYPYLWSFSGLSWTGLAISVVHSISTTTLSHRISLILGEWCIIIITVVFGSKE